MESLRFQIAQSPENSIKMPLMTPIIIVAKSFSCGESFPFFEKRSNAVVFKFYALEEGNTVIRELFHPGQGGEAVLNFK